MQTLITERLVLDPLLPEDAGSVYALRSDPRVNRYLARTPMEKPEEAMGFVERIRHGYEKGDTYYWVLRMEKLGELMGTACIWNLSPDGHSAELGYELRPEFQGKGYMQEAIEKLIDFAFAGLGLKKLSAFTHKENLPSINLLKKNGFTGPFDPPADYEYNDFMFILEQPSP